MLHLVKLVSLKTPMLPRAYAFRFLSLPQAQIDPKGGKPPPRHGSGLDLEHLMFTLLLVGL